MNVTGIELAFKKIKNVFCRWLGKSPSAVHAQGFVYFTSPEVCCLYFVFLHKVFKAMAVCIGVIAKENYPLYIKCAPNVENEVNFHFTVHTSLDVIEEKMASLGKTSSLTTTDLREFYLGQLYPSEDYRIYGYVTNTKVKFVIVVESSNTQLRDNEVRSMFRRLHNAYTDVICNPFHVPGDKIKSKSFDSIAATMIVPERKKDNPLAI